MNPLPNPHQPTAAKAGQTAGGSLTDAVIEAAVRDTIRQTSFRDDTPVPAIGSALPVPQPGRPPMTEQATGASVMMIAGGFLSLCLGAAISSVLYFSSTANETVVITVCAAPPVTFLALKSLVKGVKRAAMPDVHHHHYNGDVVQDHSTVNTTTRGLWAHTRNQLPK